MDSSEAQGDAALAKRRSIGFSTRTVDVHPPSVAQSGASLGFANRMTVGREHRSSIPDAVRQNCSLTFQTLPCRGLAGAIGQWNLQRSTGTGERIIERACQGGPVSGKTDSCFLNAVSLGFPHSCPTHAFRKTRDAEPGRLGIKPVARIFRVVNQKGARQDQTVGDLSAAPGTGQGNARS